MSRQSQPRAKPRVAPVPPEYLTEVRALDERRKACGLSHVALCICAGIAARSWAKILNPDAASGRMASKVTLDKVAAVLFPASEPRMRADGKHPAWRAKHGEEDADAGMRSELRTPAR